MLMDRLTAHVRDDDLVRILDGAYWVGWEPSDKTYVGVDHDLPVLRRTLPQSSDTQEVRLGLYGGVHVVTSVGNLTTWATGSTRSSCSRSRSTSTRPGSALLVRSAAG